MVLEIDTLSARPVYQQIIMQVKQAIARGKLKPGDQLPTVREVAAGARVNRNTVARAYKDLMHEGIIVGLPGRGSFVAYTPPIIHPGEARDSVIKAFDEALISA